LDWEQIFKRKIEELKILKPKDRLELLSEILKSLQILNYFFNNYILAEKLSEEELQEFFEKLKNLNIKIFEIDIKILKEKKDEAKKIFKGII
jgi:hypothetical protein